MNDTIKRSNIRPIGAPEGREREAGLKDVFNEIIKEKFTNIRNIRGS